MTAVLLAAGASRRLGRPKQLLRRGSETLLVRAVRSARQAVDGQVIVVLGAGQLRLRTMLRRHRLAVDVVYNPGWNEGLASSLGAGLRHVAPAARGALILLVDQAHVGAGDLHRLVRRWRRRPALAAAAHYGGRVGAPAIIPRQRFAQALALQGDVGARHLLRGLGQITTLAMPAAAFDIDTPADARAVLSGRR